jgi:hypothetical protein
MSRAVAVALAAAGLGVVAAVASGQEVSAGASALVAGPVAHAAATDPCSDPSPGECTIDKKTGCPILGPLGLGVSASILCVPLGNSLVTVVTRGATGGCVVNYYVQVALPYGPGGPGYPPPPPPPPPPKKRGPGGPGYEAVWYSNIGLGTRWWASPGTIGPASITGLGAKYRVPTGFAAWSAAGGSSASGNCPGGPPAGTFGTKAWVQLHPTLADACDQLQAELQNALQNRIGRAARKSGKLSLILTPPRRGLLTVTIAFEGSGGSGSSIAPDAASAHVAGASGCTNRVSFDGGGSSGSSIASDHRNADTGAASVARVRPKQIAALKRRLTRHRHRLTIGLNAAGRKLLSRLAAADRAYYGAHPGGRHAPTARIRINVRFTKT